MRENVRNNVDSSENSRANSANSSVNSGFKANLNANVDCHKPNDYRNEGFLKTLFALPRWARIYLAISSGLALIAFIIAFMLMQTNTTNIATLSIDKFDKYEGIYDVKLNFTNTFFRHQNGISSISLGNIVWRDGIDLDALEVLDFKGRRLKVVSAQNLENLISELGDNVLGTVSYTTDFSDSITNILRIYGWTVALLLGGFVFCNSFKLYPPPRNLVPQSLSHNLHFPNKLSAKVALHDTDTPDSHHKENLLMQENKHKIAQKNALSRRQNHALDCKKLQSAPPYMLKI